MIPPIQQLLQLSLQQHNAGTSGTREGEAVSSIPPSALSLSVAKPHPKNMAQQKLEHDKQQVSEIPKGIAALRIAGVISHTLRLRCRSSQFHYICNV